MDKGLLMLWPREREGLRAPLHLTLCGADEAGGAVREVPRVPRAVRGQVEEGVWLVVPWPDRLHAGPVAVPTKSSVPPARFGKAEHLQRGSGRQQALERRRP
eukprot:CAMPEP_0179174512 /NCGR_PEP_ID=MMETSP0796-20121207/86160_1 /TAXON_ID=73915 /ORGANISM="Pyrodinium bahamense, Strain pbaha01" /LENGTH=101 /DNA_ID=CAMNT_0020877809 /DNA_START=241 /DNA_END=542 /DNA_ORIENTATION=+